MTWRGMEKRVWMRRVPGEATAGGEAARTACMVEMSETDADADECDDFDMMMVTTMVMRTEKFEVRKVKFWRKKKN